MSVNQSRGDKNEPPQYRRSGRSGNPASPRNFSGGGGAKGGGGGSSTAPPSSAFYSGKSFKKVVSNAQGAQVRVTGPNPNLNLGSSNSSTGGRAPQNGAHIQPPLRGTPDASSTGVTVKATDASVHKSTPGLPKAPQSNAVPLSSGTTGATGPSTPVKGPADASRAFPLQFGSISPGVMHGMQVPARTNSAPPNLDEQKRAQARLDSLKATSFQNPAVPKQHLPRTDPGPVDQPNPAEARPTSKDKKDVPSSTPPVAAHAQKPTGPPMPSISGVPIQMPFHQSQIHHPFGGPNAPLQTQSMANTSLPVPLPMHMVGNPPQVPPQVFGPGIQHHQGINYQSQGLTFSSQMGPQLGNMGMAMGLAPQYQQQSMITFGGARSRVKITHPDTHEELLLDKKTDVYLNGGSLGQRSHPHGPPQSQAVPSFPPAHHMNYYPNSYNASPVLFMTPGSNTLTSAQTTPGLQAQRFYNQPSKQVTVKPAISSHAEKVGDTSAVTDKSEIPRTQRAVGEGTSGQSHKDSETIAGSSLPQSDSLTNTSFSSAAVEGSTSLANSVVQVVKKTTVNKSGSFKEEQKQPGKKDQSIPVDKIDGRSSSVSTTSVGHQGSIDSGVQETSKSSTFSLEIIKDVLETSNKVAPSNVADGSASKCDINEGINTTEVIDSGTSSDNTLKVEEPIAEIMGLKEQLKGSVDQMQDSTVSNATVAQQKEPVNNIDSKLPEAISTADLDVLSAATSSLTLGSSHDDLISNLDHRLSKLDGKDVDQFSSKESVLVSVPEASSSTLEVEGMGLISPSSSGKVNGNIAKGKKKKKEILKNADARGTTSDLYNAYKRPEEKKETSSAENVETPAVNLSEKEVSSDERHGPSKFEPEDWEDAAEISAPKMETSSKHHSEDDNDGITKKYSRDFLLKFADHCKELPEGFEVTPDITEVFASSSANVAREPYPSPGRGGDRSAMGSRLDRRPSNLGVDDKWSKGSGPTGPGWDPRLDMGYPGRGTHGVLRTPRVSAPGQYSGGILSGPMQSPGPQGGPMQRNNSDSDRWQRATGFQKGLMPSPHTPMMHKAERKYEVGKITDEEQAKQRRLKGILNKLTPQNFEKLFDQVKEVNIDNAGTLSGVIDQIFDKALMEPTFVEMYANFCSRLAVVLPDFSEENEKITFKRLLLNKCQEEFERGEREEQEANRTEEEGEIKQTKEEREEKRVKARRRMLGNIRLIGELYKEKMLTERIMHDCIQKLLGQYENPDEENIEALCKLMSTIGVMIDHSKAKEHMDAYFDMMFKLSNNLKLSSRVRFMLKDAIDLRKNKWQQRRKVEGPKKIEEVHRDAAQERQSQSNRLARGPNSNPSLRRGQPMDFGPKGSNALPSNPQMGVFRGLPHQGRGYGNPDPRFDSYESRTLSVPLRPMGDDSITLGPQGGLARGMSVRGQPSMQGIPLQGPNGYSSIPDRAGYGPRDDLGSRYIPERYSPRPAYDPPNMQENNMNYVNRDSRNTGRVLDRVRPSTPPERARVSTPPQSGPSDKVLLSEDRLHDKSIQAIKEFYSARDEKEVALCIKELNAPSFYPSMISIWVTDSFERKDMDRDSLAKLLINLAKSHDQILSQDSLVRGFESVLSTLEDAVNDAPKAAEFLGRMFARVLLENVIPYQEVWRLIHEGGEEQGRLVEIGLAAEVLGVILEIVKAEKGDPFFNDLRASSNPRLQNFRPQSIKKPSRLDKFI